MSASFASFATLATLATFASCPRNTDPANRSSSPDRAVVATVDGVAITAADVADQLRRQDHRDHRDPRDPREALEDRIVFELLARAAAGTDLRASPDDRAELQAVEAQRLIEREIEPRLTPSSISDGDVRALYERGKRHFVHGRLVQAAVLHVFTGARMKPEPRARAEQTARMLRVFLDQHPARAAADFEAIANDPSWIDRKVGVNTVWQDTEADEPFPRVVGRALAELGKQNLVSPLVGDETGYYIAMYLAEAPAENRAFADVAPELRTQMYEPWRRQRFLQLATELTAGHDIEVFTDDLTSAPARSSE